jgi:NhaP-type Na+/H+ or K+/H+ antiporter
MDAGLAGLGIIAFGLIFRSIGTYLSVLGTNLNFKERLFCVISYTPKATVQAAIGAVPLSYGVQSGDLILAMAVMSIVITAPLGAIAMQFASTRLLEKESSTI